MSDPVAGGHPLVGTPVDPLEASPVDRGTWRLFGTSHYFRLWLAQVVSGIGDWIGLVAILTIAAQISDRPAAAISLVMVARMLPGFVLGPAGGVLADRLDRKKLMVVCDLGRAVVVALLPFVTNIGTLFLASFVLEVLTLLWSPAKDASVPNLVPEEKLVAANSLGMAAGFGTFPIGAALFASLAAVADRVKEWGVVDFVHVSQEFLALWLDALTFVGSALLILTVQLPRRPRPTRRRVEWGRAFRDMADGLRFITSERTVRAVMFGMGAGLLGGAAVIPLGPVYTEQLLGSDSAGFGLLMTGMGVGAAVGVIGLSALQRFFPRELVFSTALVGSGLAIGAVASVDRLVLAVVIVGLFGLMAGSGYVAGFTLLHEKVADELRGRTFGALYTVIRLCIVVALTVFPLLAEILDGIVDDVFAGRVIDVFGRTFPVPGVRLALYLGALIVVVAGFLAALDVHRARKAAEAVERHPAASRMSPLPGRLIVLEGADAVGKSTQVLRLAMRLRQSGREVVTTFEPGATAVGQSLRELILHEHVDARTEALLIAADRAHHVADVVLPALQRGADVVSDRFVPSSLAYQGVARGLGVDEVRRLNQWATGGLEPDLVVVLDAHEDVVRTRRGGPGDRLEREGSVFQERVLHAYRSLAAEYGWVLVDALGSPDEVFESVWAAVEEHLGS